MIDLITSSALLNTPGTAELVGKETGKPPPLSQRFKFNAWSGNNLATNLFHFQDWICRENYHFDFYVGEKYMECLLVDFSDYNRWSIGAIWLFPMIDCEILTNSHHFSKKGVPVVWFL